MGSYFQSGITNRGIRSWHGEELCINDITITPRQAYEMAKANYEVIKKPLFYNWDDQTHEANRCALIHGTTGELLGVAGHEYEVAQNERLVEMAEAIQDHIILDTFVVLDEGRKVAFTGLIKGLEDNVLANDKIERYIVGYLGHDGKTGVGTLYTDTRVVCCNTLQVAMCSENQRSLAHRKGVNSDITRLIKSINVATESFNDEVQDYHLFAETRMNTEAFREMLKRVYAPELARPIMADGKPVRAKTLEDLRDWNPMVEALTTGLGTDIPGVRGTAWHGFNAVTEVLTSPSGQNAIKKFSRVLFGVNKGRIEVARDFCRELAGIKA
jgi:hypothetical protein